MIVQNTQISPFVAGIGTFGMFLVCTATLFCRANYVRLLNSVALAICMRPLDMFLMRFAAIGIYTITVQASPSAFFFSTLIPSLVLRLNFVGVSIAPFAGILLARLFEFLVTFPPRNLGLFGVVVVPITLPFALILPLNFHLNFRCNGVIGSIARAGAKTPTSVFREWGTELRTAMRTNDTDWHDTLLIRANPDAKVRGAWHQVPRCRTIDQTVLALSNYTTKGVIMHNKAIPGVRRAAQEFADAQGWAITFVLPCNGMAVLRRPEANEI